MAKINSLESFLDSYVKNLAIKNEPESFKGYSSAALHEINKRKRQSELGAKESYALSTRPYGRRDEILASYGLYDSGYKRYYDALKATELEDAITAAEEKAVNEEKDAYDSYLKYLESETKRQNSLEHSVAGHLAESKIIDPIEIYKYAIERGMTKERAEATITRVYNSVKNTVKRDILERIASNKYDVDLAVAYARSIGFGDSDIEEIRKLAEAIEKNFAIYTQSFGDEITDLENLGNQTNSSY